jgi:hypothetical protein
MKKALSILALIVFLLGFAFAEQGKQCSNRTNTGKYVTVCDGFLTPAPGAPSVPAKLLGVAIVDRYGNITGDGTVSIGGMIVQQTVQGTETVNPDCTGSITYQTWINGQPGPPLSFTFILSQNGDLTNGLSTDSGSVLSCTLTRTKDGTKTDE